MIRDNFVHYLDSEPEAFHLVLAELTAAVSEKCCSPSSFSNEAEHFEQRQCVAVFYDIGFFIGEVLEAHENGITTITFMD